MKKATILILVLTLAFMNCCKNSKPADKSDIGTLLRKTYFIDNFAGDDKNPGTAKKPIKSIKELNARLQKNARDVCFAGGQTFYGTLYLSGISRTDHDTLVITSYGEDRATINGETNEAILIKNCRNIHVINLNLTGSGRKSGNKTNGLSISHSDRCKIQNINVSGFQKSGIDLYDCTYSEADGIIATDNGFSGINVMGSVKNLSKNILIRDCKAENNPGDPSNLENHSGNGILIGVSDSIIIDHCSATNNGWDMPRQGNGPVGIWAWESDHVIIQYCISYRNKTSKKAKDGGGFDLDGGVTNSLIQYCLSYENQGAGYGLFQYAGASYWSDNTIRYCVSINDAKTTEGAGGIFIWNGSNDTLQLNKCSIYNNVIYNTTAPLISFESASAHKNFIFCNNIFIGSDYALAGFYEGSSFLGNDWWNTRGDRRFLGYPDLFRWAGKTGQEMKNGQFTGLQLDPEFTGPLITGITDPYSLDKLSGYKLRPGSPLRNKGLDLRSVFGINKPLHDFYGNPVTPGNTCEPGIYEMK
jgi:Right handed beta helix region